MTFDFKEILSATMVLFAVIDIVGSIPIIINLREKVGHIQSEKASIVATVIMILFLYLGESILNLFGVDIMSFAIAGSLILFFLALEMILGINLFKDEAPETASIVPIAFPLIAGAGTLTTLITIKTEFHDSNIIVAILLNMALVYFVLKTSAKWGKYLGKGGIAILRKVFGVVLLAIAVKIFKTSIGF